MNFFLRSAIGLAWLFTVGAVATAPVGRAENPADGKADSPRDLPMRYIFGLSPFLEDGVKDEVYRRTIGFLLEDIPLGGSLWLYDAYHLRTIAQVEVPKVRAFQSAKTRANQFREPIHKLKQFLAARVEPPATNGMKLDQAVRLPQFLDFASENLASPNHRVVIVILGSPLHRDPKEPGFSMLDGYFPSDGHLIASREKSVYGRREGSAWSGPGAEVHFGYFGDPWVSELHQEKIARFWSLFLKQQGAHLATFCGDLPTVFNALRASLGAAPTETETRHALDPAQTKIEMLRITRDVEASDWITRDVVANAAQRAPATTVGPMKIGIRWKGNLDLDLYASPRAGAETLFFEHMRSADGYYFKDHRSSPDREYEFIEFERPVNVWEVDAAVNLYKGRSPGGAGGEIRIEFDGRIYTGRFFVPASHGNEGRSGAGQEEFWARIDVPALLKLRDGARASGAPTQGR